MRTTRIIILLVFVTATLFILIRAVTSPNTAANSPQKSSGNSRKSILGFVYYNPPFSLFPPNAAISLTDDNSTSFAARPAAFGPKLASAGLSGPLWVGSGFVEDSFESHGELGCSDIPGWDGGSTASALKTSFRANTRTRLPSFSKNKASKLDTAAKLEGLEEDLDATEGHASSRVADDGTDNHFHMRSASSLSRRDSSQSSSHADIQSMQESAEIEGKVVLLMRGGCGFLEKVMWAQRRGAIAVIVGDNQRGGPLIQMFARGDEIENVTIPSVFTARTTAQLLSSLTQPGSFIEDSLDDSGNPVFKVQKSGSPKKKKTSEKAKRPVSAKTKSPSTKERRSSKQETDEDEAPLLTVDSRGWFSRLFRLGKSSRAMDPDSRPPTSGRLDWVLVDDWNDEKDRVIADGMKNKKKQSQKTAKQSADNFIIGVQDWRDPDLVAKSRPAALKGDQDAARDGSKKGTDAYAGKSDSETTTPESADGKGHGFLSKIFGDDEEDEAESSFTTFDDEDEQPEPPRNGPPSAEPHEGLWVTIIPTSGATPFFDTLLVLVVSPLVTLSVVYALLILRARIRRRRWRAPKSVVERLPVRTYHTVATSPSITPGTSTPTSSNATTPLLQHTTSRPRPRSRTTTGIPECETLTVPASTPAIPTSSTGARGRPRNEHEKGASGFSAEWRKYMGRQVECVVCLEEYVDGVSRVMSLPCGHEFHADCITPWLTTRRRTCPICKGDVVRSLAHSSRSNPRYEPYHDDSDDENGESSRDGASDLEQGIGRTSSPSQDQLSSDRAGTWFDMLSGSLGGRQSAPSRSPSPAERQ